MITYEWKVQGYYDLGWEEVFTAVTNKEARQILADYQANEKIPFRIKRVRAA